MKDDEGAPWSTERAVSSTTLQGRAIAIAAVAMGRQPGLSDRSIISFFLNIYSQTNECYFSPCASGDGQTQQAARNLQSMVSDGSQRQRRRVELISKHRPHHQAPSTAYLTAYDEAERTSGIQDTGRRTVTNGAPIRRRGSPSGQ